MRRILITIYMIAITLIIFTFTALIFYKDFQFGVARKLILIVILFYIAYKSNKYKFEIIKDLAIFSIIYSIGLSLFV